MFTFLIVIITIIAAVLVLLVLLQSGKGGGLAGIAAGGATRQILGARQAPDILEKGTWTLATAFIVLCILTNFTITDEQREESIIQQQMQGAQPTEQAPVLPPLDTESPAPGSETPSEGDPGGENQ